MTTMPAPKTSPRQTEPAPQPDADAGLIRDPRQIRALISPVRQEIVDAIHAAGPLTISQLAGHLGRPADALYFHIRTLQRVGLLIQVGTVATGRRAGSLYDVCARPLRIHYDTARPAVTKAITSVAASMVRLAQRDFARAFRLKLATIDGNRRNTWSGRTKGWLSPDQIAQVNRILAELLAIFREASPRPGATLHAATFVLTPLPEHRRAPSNARRSSPAQRADSGAPRRRKDSQ
ncbi:MAG: hypothetical protein GIKADHBN_01526 [Phycisphaerales bacterium]|nr:hypothetical protein [Phycisphaerales bacterium]